MVLDLLLVKLSSHQLYKQLAVYCIQRNVLEELADDKWHQSLQMIHSLFRLDADIAN